MADTCIDAELADIERVARIHVRCRSDAPTAAKAKAYAANQLLWQLAAWRKGRVGGPKARAKLMDAWGLLREML